MLTLCRFQSKYITGNQSSNSNSGLATCGMPNFIDEFFLKNSEKYHVSTNSKLTDELCSGVLPDYKLYTYLVQDLKYFNIGMNMFGKALALCDNETSVITLSKQIGYLANFENTYFQRSLEELEFTSLEGLKTHAPEMLKRPSPTLPEVKKYLDYISYLVFESNHYVELIASMFLMEQIYLEWAEPHSKNTEALSRLEYKHKEWILLHSGEDFTRWVNFLRDEVNRVATSESSKERATKALSEVLDLEINFFDACYDYHS